jgi:hypothetical protein
MRPEQLKALEYLNRKGTLLAPAEIHERVRAAFGATEAFLNGVPEREARRRPAPGEWCVQEIVDHLVETHRPGVHELGCLLRGERPAGGPVPASLQSTAPLERPWTDVVAELKRLHSEILAMLAAAPEGAVPEARASLVMVVNARNADGSESPVEWIEELDWKAYAAAAFRLHEIDHLNQARRALESAGRPP